MKGFISSENEYNECCRQCLVRYLNPETKTNKKLEVFIKKLRKTSF